MTAIGKGRFYNLTAGNPQQIASVATGRGYLFIQNVGGTNPVTIAPDAAPSAGQGIGLDPGSAIGGQGGSWERSGDFCPSNAFYAISTSGTTLYVFES